MTEEHNRLEHEIENGAVLSCYDKYGLKMELVWPGMNPKRMSVYCESTIDGIVQLEKYLQREMEK